MSAINPSAAGFVDEEILRQVKVGRGYVAAKFGFRNHWYPAMLSDDLAENVPRTAQVCGERILLNRINGTVFAIKDECVHRGVPLSRKIECYKKGTVTCWYHGFTYRYSDGLMTGVMGMPDSNVAGRKRIRTYPITEAQGVVFVFIGDAEEPLPALAEDVPPGFLDSDRMIRGRRTEVHANWRLGCENGFDSTHIFIHKDSSLIRNADLMLPLGLAPVDKTAFRMDEHDGAPKGVWDIFSPDTIVPVFEGQIDGETVLTGASQGSNILPHTISIWLPCALRVDPWPSPELTQYEWYVPIDGERHYYYQFLGKQVANAAEAADFDHEFHERWLEQALIGFNQDDIWAREANEPFYADDTGWLRESLFEADGNIVQWRYLADKHNRGIQQPQHLR